MAVSMLVSCNSDDDNSAVNGVSTLTVNNIPFEIGRSADNVTTKFYNEFQSRVFFISNGKMNDSWSGSAISFSIHYAAGQTSATGIYTIDEFDNYGYYLMGDYGVQFVSGTVSITELGNDIYKIVFTDLITDSHSTSPSPDITVQGSFEGSFKQN